MTTPKEFPPELLVAGIAFPVTMGYLIAPGFGWATLTVESLIIAKQMHAMYHEERERMKEHNQ